MGELLAPILFGFLFAWLVQTALDGVFDLFYKVEPKKYDYT